MNEKYKSAEASVYDYEFLISIFSNRKHGKHKKQGKLKGNETRKEL